MRILLLATDAWGGHGGIALFNRELCAALAAREDVEEIVVVPRVVHGEIRDVPAKVTFVEKAAKGHLSYARAIARCRRGAFDLVICGHINLLPAAYVIDRRPLLVVHGIEAWKPPARAIVRRLLPRCRGIVSVSALTRDRLVAWSSYAGPTFVLPNAVHLEDYGVRAPRRELQQRYGVEGKRVLLTVGRLDTRERTKGFDEVIEVLPSLPDDVVYLIAGGGSDVPRLERLAHDLGVSSRVVITGVFAEEEKRDIYALADVYVMPSRGEGFGFVFLEALASGVPAIGSKLDGSREALAKGTLGILVDPSNPAEIRAAIVEQLALGRGTIPSGLDYFSFENFVTRVSAIVDETV